MSIAIEKLEGLKRKVHVVIPSAKFEAAYQAELAQASKKAKIDGFRPGKVPAKVLEERYGQSIRFDVVHKLMNEALKDVFTQSEVNLAGMPEVDALVAEPGKDVEFDAIFEVYPEVTAKDLTGQQVEQVKANLADADVQEVLEKLRKQHADWVEVTRAAKDGDQVVIDFEGFMDGIAFAGGKAENVPLVLGSKSMIDGFEKGIEGKAPGSTFEIQVTFPAAYHAKDLAGKPAIFKMKLHTVKEAKLPELNDEFATKFGIQEGGIEALKKDLSKHLATDLENVLKMRNKEKVFSKFLDINTVEIPQALVEAEMEKLHEDMHRQQGHGHDHHHDLSDEERAILTEPAQRRVKLGLLVGDIIKKHDIKPSQDDLRQLVEKMAINYENPEEYVKWFFQDRNRLAQIESAALEDLVAKKLMETAQVSWVELSYNDAIKG